MYPIRVFWTNISVQWQTHFSVERDTHIQLYRIQLVGNIYAVIHYIYGYQPTISRQTRDHKNQIRFKISQMYTLELK